MPGGVFIKHRVVHICQAVDLLFGKHGSEAYRLLHRHRIGGQNLFCMIIIQIGAITTNCRCIESQCLIKRMDSDVMTSGDDDDLIACLSGAGQCLQRSGQNGFFAGKQGAV